MPHPKLNADAPMKDASPPVKTPNKTNNTGPNAAVVTKGSADSAGPRLFGDSPKASPRHDDGRNRKQYEQGRSVKLREELQRIQGHATHPPPKPSHHEIYNSEGGIATNNDVHPESIPSYQEIINISKGDWNTFTPYRKLVIATRYGYLDIAKFEKYALLNIHPASGTGGHLLPWAVHTKDTIYADTGFYLVKFPYINGGSIIVFGISEGNIGQTGIAQRIHSAHTSHGVAGEVIVINGNMRNCLRSFEQFVKVVSRALRPPTTGVNGEEVWIFDNESAADLHATKIYNMATSLKRDGTLKSPISINDPTSQLVSINPNHTNYYKNNKGACDEAYGRRPNDLLYREETLSVMKEFQKKFPKKRPPSSHQGCGHMLSQKESRVAQRIQRHVNLHYRGTAIDPSYLKMYQDELQLPEFSSSRYFPQDSRVNLDDLAAEWKRSNPDEEEQDEGGGTPTLSLTRSNKIARREDGIIERNEVEMSDSQGDTGEDDETVQEYPCVCGKVHSDPDYTIRCDTCDDWYEVFGNCTGYFDPDRLGDKLYQCWHCDCGTPIEARALTATPAQGQAAKKRNRDDEDCVDEYEDEEFRNKEDMGKTVQQVPRDKDERQTWLGNRKAEWRAQRKRRRSLAGEDLDEGEDTLTQSGGKCGRHGGKRKRKTCSEKECNKIVRSGGKCARHAGKKCYIKGCINLVVSGGKCCRHGAKKKRNYKTCSEKECNNIAQSGGKCARHAGKNKSKCCIKGCINLAVSRGKCHRHGGRRICSEEHCPKWAKKVGGKCEIHEWQQKNNLLASELVSIA